MNFIDIHGHYAWDIDDGMPSREDAYEALKIARDNHITHIIATPHVVPGLHGNEDIKHFKDRIHDLKELSDSFDIQIYEGCELFLNHDYLKTIQEKLFIPIENTSYILVEFDVRKELGKEYEVEDVLYEIAMQGYKPIIAHVERYFHQGIDIERIQHWIDEGYVIQVNGSSVLGIHGKTIQKNAMTLLNKGMAHAIATDTHRAIGRRIPNLQSVYERLQHTLSEQSLQTLMYYNPYHILHNENIEEIESKPSFLKRLLKRR